MRKSTIGWMAASAARGYRIAPLAVLAAALGLSACSGGAGGSSAPAAQIAVTFSAAALSVPEGGGATSVDVVLHTVLGPISQDVSCTVSDLGNGTAQAGVDYLSFQPVQVVFAAGSDDGATQSVPLVPFSDATVEGPDETVRLGLSAISGAALGNAAHATITLLDAEHASVSFDSPSLSTPDESDATYTLTAELSLPPGVSLGHDVTVHLGDAGTGTASPNADYVTFAPRTLTFAAGTTDGSQQFADLDVHDDALLEGNESVVIALSQPSAGLVLGTAPSHQLIIVDDDVGSGAFLYASHGPTGVETPLDHDAPVDLGSQAINAGPNAGTLLRLSNLGGSGLSLGAPSLAGTNATDFAIEVESAPLSHGRAAAPGEADFALGEWVPSPFAARDPLSDEDGGVRFDPDALAAWAGLDAVTVPGVEVPGVGSLTLALVRRPLPLTSDARLSIDGADVPGGPAGLLGDLSLWSGVALEAPDSHVYLALSARGARGALELPGALRRHVHLVTERSDPSNPSNPSNPSDTSAAVRCRWTDDAQLEALGFESPHDFCAEAPSTGQLASPTPSVDAPGSESLTAPDCRLALETDYQLYQKFGDASALTDYVTELIGAVSDRYFTDVQTTLSIAYLGVHTTAGDPWTSQDSGGDASALLAEFRSAWAGALPNSANLAHFISGANLGGGVAYIAVLCNSQFGFGVSGNINALVNWSTWTGTSGPLTWDFVVVAHELGHNFGTNHTHAYCPPLDTCYSNCTGTTACSLGTIMSYCHLCAGGMSNIKLQFHPTVANAMRNSVNASCLGKAALAGGEWVQYRLRFSPVSAPGAKSATLSFGHNASNHPTPLRFQLSGTAAP